MNELARFDYDRPVSPPPEPASNLLTTILSFLSRLFNSYLGYIILAVLLLILLRALAAKMSVTYSSFRDSAITIKAELPLTGDETDYDALIRQSVNASDFRSAVRYVFLKTMQSLADKNLIVWRKEKTNVEYYLELPPACRSEFRRLAEVFDRIWYGRYPADAGSYRFTVDRMNDLLFNSGGQ
jgi:hypothetical protein